MTGLKQPTPPERHEDKFTRQSLLNVELRVTILKKKFSPCNGNFT